MNVWATIILWENADPKADRLVRETDREKLTIAFVPTVEAAAEVASELVAEGAELS